MKLHRLQTLTLCTAAVVLALLAARPAGALGTAAGTVISNQATVDFTDANGNPLQVLSNIVTTTVSQVAGVLVDLDNSSTAIPGDVIYYPHPVTNTGNGPDLIDLTATSSQSWALAFYLDVDGDGLYNGAIDTPLADSDGDGDPDTGALVANASVDILVEVTVPTTATDGTVDTTTITGTSDLDNLVTETATDTTTIAGPTVTALKSVNPGGNQPPGTTLTYTVLVTNNGSGPANAVVVIDPVPANTTYVGGSAAGAGTTIEYSHDGGATYDGSDAAPVTHVRWTLAAPLAASGGSVTVSFQVTID
jgi:uncharacterized repeat protein (TIGR01451 family)